MVTLKSPAAMPIDIGIADADRKAIAAGLSKLLADSYTLYLKTHNFHWNVTGPMFNTLHLMFEGQYTSWPWRSTSWPSASAPWAIPRSAVTRSSRGCRQ